jgi:flagellar basal body-associated protein FliL
LTLNSHILVLNGYRTSSGIINCYSTRSNPGYIYPQWQRVHLVLYNLCPFAIMFICNTYIIVVTVRSSRTQIESNTNSNNRKNIDRYRQFTLLLIIVTFAFVVLTLPACIYFVFFRNHFVFRTHRHYRFMIQIFLNSIQFTSHAINFFLYCFSAQSFRHELREMFRELPRFCRYLFRQSSSSVRSKGVRLDMNNKNIKMNNEMIDKQTIVEKRTAVMALDRFDDDAIHPEYIRSLHNEKIKINIVRDDDQHQQL